MGKMIAIVDAAIVAGQHFERLEIPFDHNRETAWLQGLFAGRPGPGASEERREREDGV